MSDFTKALGAVLRNLRLANGYTQDQLAHQLGVSRSAYTYYESGKTSPDLLKLRFLAGLYQISPEYFLFPERFTPLPTKPTQKQRGNKEKEKVLHRT